jgi:hypothetical protein
MALDLIIRNALVRSTRNTDTMVDSGNNTGPGQIRRVFDLAQQYDIHLDGGYDTQELDYPQVCEITERTGWQGRWRSGTVPNFPACR